MSCASMKPTVIRSASAVVSQKTVWTSDMRSDTLNNRYRLKLTTPNNSITGLCLLKKNGDEWHGSVINEFGVKAFDFIIADDGCTLLNVASMLDKWYIRRTLADDLAFLFNVDNKDTDYQEERFEQDEITVVNYKKNQLLVMPDGSVTLINLSHKLKYELKRIIDIDHDKLIIINAN